MGFDDTLPKTISKEEQIKVHIDKYNEWNWFEDQGYYGAVIKGDGWPNWGGAGWCGGAISSYTLMKLGGQLEYERAVRTLDFAIKKSRSKWLVYSQCR